MRLRKDKDHDIITLASKYANKVNQDSDFLEQKVRKHCTVLLQSGPTTKQS